MNSGVKKNAMISFHACWSYCPIIIFNDPVVSFFFFFVFSHLKFVFVVFEEQIDVALLA